MSLGHGASIVRDGLVLHLDAANKKSYPGSGTTWYDLSGNSKNATLTNGPTYSTTNNGSFVFDGIDDYVQVNYPELALSIPSMTVETWFKTTTTSQVSMFGSYNNLSPSPIIFTINLNRGFGGRDVASAGYTGLYIRDTANRYLTGYTGAPIYDGTWHSFTWRIINSAANSHEVYVDGSLVSLVNTDTTSPSTFVNFEYPVGINSFHGRGIFNAGPASTHGATLIYNRALSVAEIKQNFEALRGRYGI